MMGGSAGQRGRILLNGVEIPGKTSTMLKQDDVISFFTPGGGGMFPPMERVPGLTEQDLRNGIISPEYAVSCRKR
jgi:N-methylhydantoinase B